MIRLFLKNLLLFAKPKIEELVCSNLFIDGKPYLYLYWQVANAFKVRIKGHKTIYSAENTVIFKIHGELTQVVLTYSNIWRKQRVTVPILKLSMDASVLSNLMTDNFRPKRKTAVSGVQINAVRSAEFLDHPSACRVVLPSLSIQQPFLSLKHHAYE